MKAGEVRKLKQGLYRVFWRDGGTSLAAVGITSDGWRWLAPVNWVAPSVDKSAWRMVDRVVMIARTF